MTEGRINLYFDLSLPDHCRAYELIQAQGRRHKTAFVVAAVISQSGLSIDAVKMALAEVLADYQLQAGAKIAPPAAPAKGEVPSQPQAPPLPEFLFEDLKNF